MNSYTFEFGEFGDLVSVKASSLEEAITKAQKVSGEQDVHLISQRKVN